MANTVHNIIDFEGDEAKIREMFEAIQKDEEGLGSIDFEKILPMPKELDIEESTRTMHGYDQVRLYLNHDDRCDKAKLLALSAEEAKKNVPELFVQSEEEWALGKQALLNQLTYGATTWYGWRMEHWGTKWNAYGQEPGEKNQLRFCTAWSPPTPILAKLAGKYPDLVFHHRWADEALGQNCGEATYSNGSLESYRHLGRVVLTIRNFEVSAYENVVTEVH